MRSRFNLLAIPSHLTDAPSFYRCLGPLAALRVQRPSLQISLVEMITWPVLAMHDAVMLQRPHTQQSVEVAAVACRHGLPLWVEYDDDVFDVPIENPGADVYEGAAERMIAILALADVVTASTPALAEKLRQYARDVQVVPNALMTNMVGAIPDHDGKQRKNLILWRGSSTHQRDLDDHLDALVGVADRHPGTTWIFQGLDRRSYRVRERFGTRAMVGKGLDPIDYFGWLSQLLPRVTIVPLADNAFNKSKSNIGWLESTFAGGITIAPDWPEWRRPGVLNYRNNDELGAHLDRALTMPDEHLNNLWRAARDYVTERLGIDTVNHQRSGIIDMLEKMSASAKWRDCKRAAFFKAAPSFPIMNAAVP